MMGLKRESRALRFDGESKRLEVLDQRQLPQREHWVVVTSTQQMVELIQGLAVRGAPLIGVAAALSLALRAAEPGSVDESLLQAESARLREARPTAVNLMLAVDRMMRGPRPVSPEAWIARALEIFDEDVRLCDEMARAGAELVKPGERLMTYCNAGALATVGVGTALGVIYEAHRLGRVERVYVCETRPLLQGARLTAWELERWGIPYTLVCDNMIGSVMREGRVSRVFTGADRVALNGDFANKVGTYNLAVLAKHHRVPFHAVAPRTTLDPRCESGLEIPIEDRRREEVLGAEGAFGSVRWAPESAEVHNPSFDVTPADLVESIVLDGHSVSRAELSQGALRRIVSDS